MRSKTVRTRLLAAVIALCGATLHVAAQTDSLSLSVEQLFEQGIAQSLRIGADQLKEEMADLRPARRVPCACPTSR